MPSSQPSILPAINSVENQRRRRWRMLKDSLATQGVAIGGVSVIIAIVLIFFYLLVVVLPLFSSADAERAAVYTLPGETGPTLHLAMEEQAEIGFRLTGKGNAQFFSTRSGEMIKDLSLDIPAGAEITSFSAGQPGPARLALGFSNGSALVVRHIYEVTYPNDQRLITPGIAYPLGEEPLDIDDSGEALTHIAFQDGEEEATLVAHTADGRLLLTSFKKEESFTDDAPTLERNQVTLDSTEAAISQLLLDKEQRNLYIVTEDGGLIHVDVSDKEDPQLVQKLRLVDKGLKVTTVQFLAGDISLLVGDSSGRVVQWFGVRDQRGNEVLTPIREFSLKKSPITGIASEYNRKGFITVDQSGELAIYHSTAERLVFHDFTSATAVAAIAVAPRADAILAEDLNGQMNFWTVDNEHPEISWSALWGEVWYESYEKPVYSWQSSSASNDFEPKLSLTPLVYGTIKAAFYAMLLAVP
ncbi:hypothetical protein, partial [Kaarinaea lacus]